MKFEQVDQVVGDLKWISSKQGRIIYDFIRETKPTNCLELGFFHGKSSCYIGAALHENGHGKLVTIDLPDARQRDPNLSDLLAQLGLEDYVSPIYMPGGYNWALWTYLRDNSKGDYIEPMFDFCFLDGAHIWQIDGFAFFLAEKLIRPGGWLLLDDLKWSVGGYVEQMKAGRLNFPPEEVEKTIAGTANMLHFDYNEPAVLQIYTYLVRQHPAFEDFAVYRDHWAWARKSGGSSDVLFTELLTKLHGAEQLVFDKKSVPPEHQVNDLPSTPNVEANAQVLPVSFYTDLSMPIAAWNHARTEAERRVERIPIIWRFPLLKKLFTVIMRGLSSGRVWAAQHEVMEAMKSNIDEMKRRVD